MLFTWNTNNLCIVFRQWHVRSTTSLIISLIAVVLLGMGYEGLRAFSRRKELQWNQQIADTPRKSHPILPSCLYLSARTCLFYFPCFVCKGG